MGKQTTDHRPYELGAILKYNDYTLEWARMGRCADENGPAKAFSRLEIASYLDSINYEAWLSLHRSGDIIFEGQGPESPY